MKLIRILSISSLLAFTLHAHAGKDCKGIDQATCAQKSSCTWIDGYKRSDGREVNGYCRTHRKPVATRSSDHTKSDK